MKKNCYISEQQAHSLSHVDVHLRTKLRAVGLTLQKKIFHKWEPHRGWLAQIIDLTLWKFFALTGPRSNRACARIISREIEI